MSQSPPTNPPGNQRKVPPGASLHEEFGADYEADPTSINQIPREHSPAPARPAGTMHPPPVGPNAPAPPAAGHFASASPSLSHIGAPASYGTPGHSLTGLSSSAAPSSMMSGPMSSGAAGMSMPGPSMVQVSGVIAQPTP